MALPTELPADEVHVWVAALDVADANVQRFASMLPPPERRRGDTLDSPLRRRFLCRRGVRRAILARYTGCPLDQLHLRAGPRGKPELAAGDLHFSCADSGDLAVVAVARGRRVGVDVERLRRVMDPLAVAHMHFTNAEHAELCALPPGQRDAAFLRGWTRKEAYVKAVADGLARALDSFAVSLASPTELARTEIVDDTPLGRWSLQAFVPAAGHVAAVATQGHAWRSRSLRW
jgi:4'-phosphopantetheinyl transferase